MKDRENTSYAKGYADGIKNTYEVVVPDKLKQFAERLKKKLEESNFINNGLWLVDTQVLIYKTLKEFINKGDEER